MNRRYIVTNHFLLHNIGMKNFCNNCLRKILSVFLFVSVGFFCSAEKTKIDGLFRYKMGNGLELYVVENHDVPLVYIEVAVRTGAIGQTKDTAGLFHLYEHMLFKGNALHKDASSINRALADLGVADHNGVTSTDYVRYYFTVPADKLENGLAFWNAAMRTPLLDEHEFENEKKVVLSEIQAEQADPSYVLHYFRNLTMFPDRPYETDPRGSFTVVKNATIAQMRNMQKEFYIPCNSAVFIGGDINPDVACLLVEKIFGTWSNNGFVTRDNGLQQSKDPFAETKYLVMPYDKMAPGLAQVQLEWRGPDIDYDYEDTDYAQYFDYILSDPDSLLKNSLASNGEYGIPDPTYVGSYVSLARKNSISGCYAVMGDPENNLVSRVKKITEEVQNEIYQKSCSDKNQYSGKKIRKYEEKFNDLLVQASETAEGLVSLARQAWIEGDIEYFLGNKKLPGIKQKKVQSFVDEYYIKRKPLVTVLVNPQVYEKIKKDFDEAGFYEVKIDEKVWWQIEKFASDPSTYPTVSDYECEKEIYIPGESKTVVKAGGNARKYETAVLNNGIRLYVNKTTSKMNAIAIGCLGGYEKFTPEYSGLESCLFDVMSMSSDSFSMEERNKLAYDNDVSISKFCRTFGTVLYMYGQDRYFNKMVPVFVDGFLNPKFADNVMKDISDSNAQKVQRTLNDPSSLLSYNVIKDIYRGHPFESRGNVLPESLKNITAEKMKELHRQIIGGGDFFIAATGNIDVKKLKAELNKSIGKLVFDERLKYEKKNIPLLKIEKKDPVVLTHPSCLGTAYCARIFTGPETGNPDVCAAFLAAQIYSETLYNVVRINHGICYTPYSSVSVSKAPLCQDYLFKVSDYKNVGKAMKEAESYMSQGISVEKSNSDGTYEFSKIEDNLESFKNKWINASYSESKTTSGQMFRIMTNLMAYGDIDYDLKELDQMKKVTAEDIVRVFNKYWVEGNSIWYAITFPGNEKNLSF